MPGLKENLNYPRRMVVFAVFDIIDIMGGEYERSAAGDIKVKLSVLGKTGEYAFAVTELTSETSILHLSLLHTIEPLAEEEKQLAAHYLMDHVLHYIDEEQAFRNGTPDCRTDSEVKNH